MEKSLSARSTTRACLTNRQEAVLRAYVDALLPPLLVGPPALNGSSDYLVLSKNDAIAVNTATESLIDSSVRRYWEYRLSNDPLYMDALVTTIRFKLSTFDSFSTLMLLNIMDTTIGTCLLFNTYQHRRRFVDYTLQHRSKMLLPSLQFSKVVLLRKVFQSLKKLLCVVLPLRIIARVWTM
jgi:hypothetical protein